MISLPWEVIDYIYSFNDMTKINYNICLSELLETIKQKKNYKKVLKHMVFLKNGPIYRIPSILKPNVKFYLFIHKFRSF